MWQRRELKERGKQNLKRYHWSAVLACLILALLQTLAGAGSSNNSAMSSNSGIDAIYDPYGYSDEADYGSMYGLYEEDPDILNSMINNTESTFDLDSFMEYFESYAMSNSGSDVFSGILTADILMFGILLALLRILLNFFIVNPVMVGHSSFFYKNRYEKTSVGELAFAFNREDLFPVVKTMFLRDLYVVLWTFLLIIPGIVKSYAYRMVPFILSEYPQMSAKEALHLSNEMTRGHKLKMFILDFSFFGWYFIGALTFGIVNVVYTRPYVYATEAELYDALKQPFRRESSEADVF